MLSKSKPRIHSPTMMAYYVSNLELAFLFHKKGVFLCLVNLSLNYSLDKWYKTGFKIPLTLFSHLSEKSLGIWYHNISISIEVFLHLCTDSFQKMMGFNWFFEAPGEIFHDLWWKIGENRCFWWMKNSNIWPYLESEIWFIALIKQKTAVLAWYYISFHFWVQTFHFH